MSGAALPFHSGQRVLQLRAGTAKVAASRAPERIKPALTPAWQAALAEQTVAFVAFPAPDGAPRAAIAGGRPGFLAAPTPTRIVLDWSALAGNGAGNGAGDPPAADAPVALLCLLPPNGEPLKLNGHVETVENGRVTIRLRQAQASGTRFAHRRGRAAPVAPVAPDASASAPTAPAPDGDLLTQLQRCDTLLVASMHKDREAPGGLCMTLAYRGGLPGFTSLTDDGALVWAEYDGSGFFSTLGNLMMEPRCSVIALSSAAGDALRLDGRAEILWQNDQAQALVGARTAVRLRTERAERLPDLLNACQPLLAYAAALARVPRGPAGAGSLRLRVAEKVAETADTVSFYLADPSGAPLPPYAAGQHLTLTLPLGEGAGLQRHYSLSQYQPAPERYRLTVKRQHDAQTQADSGSQFLHDRLEAGDLVEASPPKGEYILPETLERPLVFVCAGIGVTPMIAMLQELALRAPAHPVWFLYGTRNGGTRAFSRDLEALKRCLPNARWHIRYSQPRAEDIVAEDEGETGRIDLDTLRAVLPFDAYDFYLCGPDGFLIELCAGLRGLGIAEARMHVESFGIGEATATAIDGGLDAVLPIARSVHFRRSGIAARWEPGSGSLLELAEKAGVRAPSSCLTGMCGTCSQRLLSGRIAYGRKIGIQPDEGDILLCSALPASDVEIDA